MRLLCLLLSHLPARVEQQHNPRLAGQPLVVLRAWDGCVLDASPEALAAGLAPGDSRRRVEQLCPQAVLLPAREPLYQACHDRLAAVLAGFAPAVETSGLGEFFIEVGALARTFPSEKVLALRLAAQAQQAVQLQPTVGIAANKFTAAQAARQAAGQSSRVLAVPPGAERQFLAPLPLTVLPDPPAEVLRRLHLFGITTLGGFGQLPHAAAVYQFGPSVAALHNLARGIDPRPLAAESPPPLVTRSLVLPEPIGERPLVLAALERLAGRLAHALDQSGYHALALSLAVRTADGQAHTAGVPVKPPSADSAHLCRLAGRLLGKLPLAAPVAELALTAYPLREWHHGARQLTLLAPALQFKLRRFQEAVSALQKRFGEWVVRVAGTLGPPLPLPIHVQARPDGAPAYLRWRGWSRSVEQVYEYWREHTAWWDRPITRDYYLVEAAGGLTFTVFRDAAGQWFLDRHR